MLADAQTIDVVIPISSDALMLVISDMHPWPDPDANARFGQYMAKIEWYSRYVADDEFETKHPGVSPAKVIISVVSLVPASARMRELRLIQCEKNGANIPITIAYADEAKESTDSGHASPADETQKRIRATAKRRLLVHGWIAAAIGAVPMFAAQVASPLQSQSAVISTLAGICFWAGALTLVVGFGMVLWSQQDW